MLSYGKVHKNPAEWYLPEKNAYSVDFAAASARWMRRSLPTKGSSDLTGFFWRSLSRKMRSSAPEDMNGASALMLSPRASMAQTILSTVEVRRKGARECHG